MRQAYYGDISVEAQSHKPDESDKICTTIVHLIKGHLV